MVSTVNDEVIYPFAARHDIALIKGCSLSGQLVITVATGKIGAAAGASSNCIYLVRAEAD